MTSAYVLSGGGSLGAVQVGMLASLAARGTVPDMVIGTSAGALNAAFIASRGADAASIDALALIWAQLGRRDVFPVQPLRQLSALVGRRSSLFSDRGLRDLIREHLDSTSFCEAKIPLHVVATDLRSGQEVLLSEGDLVTAVLASCAIPGLLPTVERNGIPLVDGGLANNTAISQAVGLGADEIYVLPTGYACALPEPPRTVTATAVHAVTLLTQQRLILDVARYAGRVSLKVLPPLCPLGISPVDFRHAEVLMDRARAATDRWLAQGGTNFPHPETFLSMHQHGPQVDSAATPQELFP